MTLRGALIGAATGAAAFYVMNPNKDQGIFDVLTWAVGGTQFIGVGALVGYIVS